MNILVKYLKKNLKNEKKKRLKQTRVRERYVFSYRGLYFPDLCQFLTWNEELHLPAVIQSFWFYFISFYLFLQALKGIYLPSPARRAQYQAGFHQNFHLPEYALHCRLCCCQTSFSFLEEKSKFRRDKKKRGGMGGEKLHCVQIVLQGKKTAEVVLQSALRKHRAHTGCESPVATVIVQKKAKCIWDSLLT